MAYGDGWSLLECVPDDFAAHGLPLIDAIEDKILVIEAQLLEAFPSLEKVARPFRMKRR